MNREQIKKWAREADEYALKHYKPHGPLAYGYDNIRDEHFARLVRNAALEEAKALKAERDEARAERDQAVKQMEAGWIHVCETTIADVVKENDALLEALRELNEATNATFPAFDAGGTAQLAWGDRIYNARQRARSLLGETT